MADRREVIQEFGQWFAAAQEVDERPDRLSGANEYMRAADTCTILRETAAAGVPN